MPKPKPFAKPNFPDTIVQDYGRAIINEVNAIDRLIKEILFPQLDKITNTKSERLDSTIKLDVELKELAGVALVAELIRRIKSKFYGEFLGEDQEPSQKFFTRSARRMSKTFLDRTKEFTEKRFVSEFKKQVGTEPTPKQMNVDEFIKDATRKNVALIKTVPQQYFNKIQTLTEEAVNRGQLTREVKEELLNIRETTKNSARLIARDQVGKLVSVTNEARQKNLGVTHYIWRTMRDVRVRSFSNTNGASDHQRLEGALIAWNKPPITVFKGKRAGERHHAGTDIQDRCFSEPVFDHITGVEHPNTKAARKKSIALGLL